MTKPNAPIAEMSGDLHGAFFVVLKAARDAGWTKEQRRQLKGELSDAYNAGWDRFVEVAGNHFVLTP